MVDLVTILTLVSRNQNTPALVSSEYVQQHFYDGKLFNSDK